MEFIWTRPIGEGTSVRAVFEELYERRRIAYTTVMNTMSRLARKKLLRTERVGIAYIYYPTVTQQEFISRFVGRILERLVVGFGGGVLDSIDVLPDPQAAARARALIEEIARRRTAEESA